MHLNPPARRLISLSTLALLVMGALCPAPVAAQALHYDASSGTWVRSPARTLYVTPRRAPDVVVRVRPYVLPVRVIAPRRPIEPTPIEPLTPGLETRLVVGAGFGALGSLRRRGRAGMASELHVGVERGAAEFDLSVLFAPGALGRQVTGLAPQGGGLYGAGASLSYRPWNHLRLHPVVGLGFEALFANPRQEQSHAAFGAVGRLGVEITFPLETGSLALGLDGTLHQVLASSASFPGRASSLYGFGAHLDYRFGR
ncbi:MAG: hypothetical protein GXP55_03580 [Deltaproteobacteria bacterium]|nr:hypothetical protein [Deltaproteobacteria bacterium]